MQFSNYKNANNMKHAENRIQFKIQYNQAQSSVVFPLNPTSFHVVISHHLNSCQKTFKLTQISPG